MPNPPQGPIYTSPDLDMELLVFQKGYPPGRATLRTLRSYSANVEAGLNDRLNTETQQRKDADAAEASARQSADNSEAQTRATADAALGQRIDTEASTRAQADTAEASARQSADTQEAQTRAAADASLQSQITTEIADRKAAVSAEAKTRGDADTAEATARANADTQEASTRAAADTALDARLTTVEGKLPRTATLTYPGSDLTWIYPTAFAAGVVPVIEAVVETAANSTALFNCQLVGPPTNTAVKIRINTIPAASVSLLGLVNLNLFQQAPSGVKLHVTARIPQ